MCSAEKLHFCGYNLMVLKKKKPHFYQKLQSSVEGLRPVSRRFGVLTVSLFGLF